MTRKYLLYSALSGCVWAFIALAVAAVLLRDVYFVIGGMIFSPLIGVMIGRVFPPFDKVHWIAQSMISLLTLYLAVALFGLACGLFLPDNSSALFFGSTMIEWMVLFIWGITATGLVVILWPLSYLNHRLLSEAVAEPN